MKKYLISCACFLVGYFQVINAQSIQNSVLQNKKFAHIISPSSKNGWIEFRKEAIYTGRNVFQMAPELFNLKAQDEFRLFKEHVDLAGNKHYKYAQFYQGVRVEGIEQMAHERYGKLHLVNGDFIDDLHINVMPSITTDQAVQVALQNFPAKKYLWEDTIAERNFKLKQHDNNATLFPAPELLIVKKNPKGPMTAGNYVLAYRMYLFAKIPNIAKYVYVDAHTGQIIRTRELELQCNATTYETTYNSSQTVYTDYRTESCHGYYDDVTQYFSINDCNPDSEIRSYYSGSYGGYEYGDDFLKCSPDNTWYGGGGTLMVMSSLWAVSKAFAYFSDVYGHESFDGSSGLIDVYNNKTYFTDDDEAYCSNANYTNIIDNLNFGAGSDCTPGTLDDYNPLDIVGHEFTHGIIEYAHWDALDYSEESGAINESFADIFGEMVEHYIEGGDMTWLHGEDMTTGPNRSFINPDDEGDPDTYFGTNWASLDGDDNGGVHTNSSVQNHMFYLLSEGGAGVTDHGVDYYVEGIGWNSARAIAWQAMMEYLDGSDGFITARNAWIQSAIDLYGSCSQEMISVGQAWQAVGVTEYTAFDLASICATYILTGYADATYGIENSILIGGDFFTDCTSTVSSTATVNFESGYYIQFNPGFTAQNGCNLTAWIDECEISDYDPDDVRIASDASNENVNTVSVANSTYKLFPVPADAYLNIDFLLNAASDITISIYNVSGSKVLTGNYPSGSANDNFIISVETKSLANGIYYAAILMNDVSVIEKFIVQH